MKLTKVEQIDAFIEAIDKCEGDVYLKSQYGDCYNLKSKLTQYVAVAALLQDEDETLELWCDEKDDENNIRKFLCDNEEVL